MNFADCTYSGPSITEPELLERLPSELAAILRQVNGLVAYRGGFHLRGVCSEPAWHSLQSAWEGAESFVARYDDVHPTDVPFAQDPLGDQFLLREGMVHRLWAETGDLEPIGSSLGAFLDAVQSDPVEVLSLGPLLRFKQEGGSLTPGQLLSVYPPYCAEESSRGVSLRAIPALERLAFLAELAGQVRGLPEGTPIRIRTTS